jgi:transposase
VAGKRPVRFGAVRFDPQFVLAGTQWSAGERSEPKRNGGSAKSAGDPEACMPPNPEVSYKRKYRRNSAEYKARMVEEAERCSESGAIGALLRREGLYSSMLSYWRGGLS